MEKKRDVDFQTFMCSAHEKILEEHHVSVNKAIQ